MTAEPNASTSTNTTTSAAQSSSGATSQPGIDTEGARLLAELGLSADQPANGTEVENAESDDSEFITPTAFLRYALGRHGRTLEESQLPETLLATFQSEIFADWRAATNAEQAPQVPKDVARVAVGKVGEREIAIARLGVGAPMAVAALEELIALGVKRVIVVGTGGSLQPELPMGSLAIATGAIREDGASFHYAPAGVEVMPDADLSRALGEAVVAQGGVVTLGPVWTTDAPYRELNSKVAVYSAMGALAVEMEAAALFALATFREVKLALLLAISDELFHEWRPGFHAEEVRLAERVAAQAALALTAQ